MIISLNSKMYIKPIKVNYALSWITLTQEIFIKEFYTKELSKIKMEIRNILINNKSYSG